MIGMLADIGKTCLPRALLEKPGMLTPAEYSLVKAHVRLGLELLMNLYQWGGTLFDDALVERFIEAIGPFPVDSLVELTNGEVAVVLRHDRGHGLRPLVRLLAGPDRVPLPEPVEFDLTRQARGAPATRRSLLRGLPAGAHGLGLPDRFAV